MSQTDANKDKNSGVNSDVNSDVTGDSAAEQTVAASAPRSPDEIRAEGNHLKDEASLYLQQHAHNPIDWYPWGDEALEKSRREDKPIFLSIGYSSCHWCHVMEHEVFEDDEVAQFMNENYVCIKVDREERPDIDAIYMNAVQIITGRGGWPLSVFLTPNQTPFFGGTYFPRDHFMQLVTKVNEVFGEKRGELENQGAQLSQRVLALPQTPPGSESLKVDEEMIAAAAQQGEVNFDGKWGGFKSEQKFPTPVRWQFLLHHYRKTGNILFANLTARTLSAMAAGGIYDHVGGGFHRYTVDNKWIVPHFEKMLYDNAQLASLYFEAGVVLERSDFLAVGKDVLDFLLRDMRDEGGAFYSSYDADSGGVEGSYYVWTPDDITIAVGADDGPVLAELLRVGLPGSFEDDQSVITRQSDLAEVAAEHERDPEEVAGLLAKHRDSMRAYRAKRQAPGLDRKIITSWNGLTITAFAYGYMATGSEEYRAAALKAGQYIWQNHMDAEGRLFRASNDDQPVGDGILDDYAMMAAAYLDLYQITGDPEQLARSIALVEIVRRDFVSEKGGWYLTGVDTRVPLGRRIDLYDSVVPSGIAIMLQDLVRLSALTGNQEYRQEAQATLDQYAALMSHTNLEQAGWFDAATRLAGPYYDVVIAGDVGDAATEELTRAMLATVPLSGVLARVPAGGADGELLELAPATAKKGALEGRPTAYVCEFGACKEPTGDPARLLEQLRSGWEK